MATMAALCFTQWLWPANLNRSNLNWLELAMWFRNRHRRRRLALKWLAQLSRVRFWSLSVLWLASSFESDAYWPNTRRASSIAPVDLVVRRPTLGGTLPVIWRRTGRIIWRQRACVTTPTPNRPIFTLKSTRSTIQTRSITRSIMWPRASTSRLATSIFTRNHTSTHRQWRIRRRKKRNRGRVGGQINRSFPFITTNTRKALSFFMVLNEPDDKEPKWGNCVRYTAYRLPGTEFINVHFILQLY